MSFLASFRTDQLITQLISETDPSGPNALKLIERLKKAGPKVIPKIIDALAMSDKMHTMAFVDILASQVSDKTLHFYREGLADGGERVLKGTAWALSSSHNYNPNSLLDFFDDKEVSKAALIDILSVHKKDLSVHELLRRAYEMEPREKAALFKIIEDSVTIDMVPDLIARMGGKDPVVKIHLMQLLAKFNKMEINQALEMQLKDPNKLVRSAALAALAQREGRIDIAKVSALLLDPDLDVQNRAVDVLIKINDPDTVKYLVDALKDENEYCRRSAVEVLNEVGNPNSVKVLLAAIKDDDWWVRARAGDALADIGGPKVMDSVLELIKDKDEDIRRTAIEILNAMKDERAVDALMKATDDSDWWVRERAVDALAQIDSKKAVPKLVSMLGSDAKTNTVVLRALGKLGDYTLIEKITPLLNQPDQQVQVEAIKAITQLATEQHVDTVRTLLNKIKQSSNPAIINSADKALKDIDDRFSESVLKENIRAEKMHEHTRTLLLETEEIDNLIAASKVQSLDETASSGVRMAPAVLDISTLEPGAVIEGRYKFIEKIGKGAFGTVLLMQDQIVDERLILKFLNQNVSADEEMMKRFVHELRYSRMITHKNVIRIYDFLYLQGAYAISMEYFPSHTLSGEIPDHKPMAFEKALK